MNHRIFPTLLILTLAIVLQACESPTTTTVAFDPTMVHAGERALFVVSEGNGTNGSLDAMILRSTPADDSGIVTGMTLPNDVHILGDVVYVLENSGIMDMVNADSLRKLGSINLGANGANKMAQIGASTFLVTQRSSTSAAIVDVSKRAVVDSISVGANNAEVGVLGANMYVTLSPYLQPGAIEIIDPVSHKIVNTRAVVAGPEFLLVDSVHNQLILGCTGDWATIGSMIYFLDPATLAVKDSIAEPVGSLGSMILGDRLYAILGSNVIPFDLVSHAAGAKFLSQDHAYFKGIYDAQSNELFLGDAKDYTHRGTVDAYNAATGALLWSQSAGIAPGHFAFYH